MSLIDFRTPLLLFIPVSVFITYMSCESTSSSVNFAYPCQTSFSHDSSNEEDDCYEFAIRVQRRAIAYSGCFKQDTIFTGRFECFIFSGVAGNSFLLLDSRTPTPLHFGSPEGPDYFRLVPKPKHISRWKEDWEKLELLGRGAFGSVVKARNKIDSRIYAGMCLINDIRFF